MRELKAKSRFISRPRIVFLSIIIIGIYVVANEILSIGATISFMIVMSFFNYITSIARFHKFVYDDDKVIVTNTWYPFIHDEIEISEIQKVELTVATNIGNAIVFYFTNGRKKLYGVEARREEIEELIKFIKEKIDYDE